MVVEYTLKQKLLGRTHAKAAPIFGSVKIMSVKNIVSIRKKFIPFLTPKK